MNLRNYLGAECRTAREEMGDESEEFLQVLGWAGWRGRGKGAGKGGGQGPETKGFWGQDLKRKGSRDRMVKAGEQDKAEGGSLGHWRPREVGNKPIWPAGGATSWTPSGRAKGWTESSAKG